MTIFNKTHSGLVRSLFGLIGVGVFGISAAADLDDTVDSLPMVLTPTRLHQSIAEVPASVTIITAEMIERLGITSIPEALRLVPGMAVTQVSGNDYRINYHGTNILTPRRMNVLLDGMSIYRPAFARVDWSILPISMNDVARIEVTRSPASATYGANSMLAVVNIISTNPKEAAGILLSGAVGTSHKSRETLRGGGKFGESTNFRITAERSDDAGFDYNSSMGAAHDSTVLKNLNFRSVTDIANGQSLDLQLIMSRNHKEIEFVDAGQLNFPDIKSRDYYINATWTKEISDRHSLQLRGNLARNSNYQPWRTCVPSVTLLPELAALYRQNPAYVQAILARRVPSGGTASDNALALAVMQAVAQMGAAAAGKTCVETNQNLKESRDDIELQDTYVFSDALRMVSGVGARQDKGNSITYLNGAQTNTSFQTFANVEYQPIRRALINVGGYAERDNLSGFTFSPRAAINVTVADGNTVRFAVSEATRRPAIQEQNAYWRYPTSNYSAPVLGQQTGHFYQSAISPGNLASEKIVSREFGYLGNFQRIGVLLDAKIFDDNLYSLISEKLQLSDYHPTNTNVTNLRGAEVQVAYNPSTKTNMTLTYAYLDNKSSSPLEQTQYSNNSGSASWAHTYDSGWGVSLAYYGYSGNTNQSSYGRQDFTVAKTFKSGPHQSWSWRGTARHLNKPSAFYPISATTFREARMNDSMQYLFSLNIAYR